MSCFEQGGVKTWKKVHQNTNILPQALYPELPYEVDLCKKSVSKKINILEVIFQIYINIDPIYLWGINSGKAQNEKVFFQKKGSKYKNLEVKCYVLSRVGWKHERTGIKIRAFCFKHFAQSCHMRSTFAERVFQQKSTCWPNMYFFPNGVSGIYYDFGAPGMRGSIRLVFRIPLERELRKAVVKINWNIKKETNKD